VLWPLLLTLTATGAGSAAGGLAGSLDLRLGSGAEWDTNARRAIGGADAAPAGAPAAPEGDGLVRLLLDASGRLDLGPTHALTLGNTLGAKRFATLGTEDLLAHELSVGGVHRVAPWLTALPSGLARSSRVRSGARDHDVVLASLALVATPLRALELEASAGAGRFAFAPEPRFSHAGPRAGGALTLHPGARTSVSLRLDHLWRDYEGNAPLVVTGPDGAPLLSFCDAPPLPAGCVPRPRKDRELQLAAGATYRGLFVLGGQYLLRRQRSNAAVEDVDRHRVSLFATLPLPLGATGSVLLALQVNDGLSPTDARLLAEDDENQNSVQLQVRRKVSEQLAVEVRYALFANQFSTADVSFVRQTVHVGLGFRGRLLGER
jgi:hypothetical protein